MAVMRMNHNKAYEFCKKSVKLKTTPKYVRLQMKDFIRLLPHLYIPAKVYWQFFTSVH